MLPDFSFFNAVTMPSQGIIYDWEALSSNQNYYDAANLSYTADFYSCARHIMTFPLILRFEKPLQFNLSVSYQYDFAEYASRTAQDVPGSPSDRKMNQVFSNWFVDIFYPLPFNFSVVASAGFSSARSNMKYEKIYRYNYDAWSLLAGLRYEY
ncbi:hypothetical protein COY52_10960 [Candidatus Desantisbacteria bacterium CG_4_10_14_0_8_um_filter_48_22]|uniref:Outer membrane protein beta-barrel domain-containing protein n=1 Tax=Candidatus Desantisbacteria bacterium CG_4_10_14_0_8_um_filter_48_22 TaxID=1974543 RepID=A0A2M7S5P8_9BACT|nr:MAG: hypothetical protein COS16_05990 [Candidatus Desantisbacteria bacterium CG02_land_8_20_14_3_00_49_13]PIZ14826.1 MAG: hypothetical protein COY52_10960 [Candidatus Desantisbacteria bacterium CG_4_10_14_0_8_um_filter_48_22]